MTDREKFEKWFADSFRDGVNLEYLKALQSVLANNVTKLFEENAQLQAENLKLREALEAYMTDCDTSEVMGVAEEALASTPAQSLQEHDNEIIERCAEEAEGHVFADDAAKAIRELKGK